MLQFDKDGHLYPHEPIKTDLPTFEATFVTNPHRRVIFVEFCEFLKGLEGLELGPFFVWVNGSFVTQKLFPKDIDVVVFVGHQNFPEKELLLKKNLYKSATLDCYFAISYPEGHPMQALFKMDRAEWLFLYVGTRRNPKTGKRSSKGFIQLDF
jgi:hypothetical protein